MKTIRFLFLIIAYYTINCHSQVINQLKTLYFQPVMNPSPLVYEDSVAVLYKGNDTTVFNVIASNNQLALQLIKLGDKIYTAKGQLVYDYGLEQGDTFYYQNGPEVDLLIVDSVYYKSISHLTKKVWALTEIVSQNPGRIEWIEGMGSFDFGWDYGKYNLTTTDGPQYIATWCLKDSILYYDTLSLTYYHVTPSCDFTTIRKNLSVIDQREKQAIQVNMYTVREKGKLNIDMDAIYSGFVEVFDNMGQTIVSKSFDKQKLLEITLPDKDVSHVLYVRITTPGFTLVRIVGY
jgi:hypothetical protein